MTRPLYVALTPDGNFGWGMCSHYLKRELRQLHRRVHVIEDDAPGWLPGPVFHALTDLELTPMRPVRGPINVGYVFFENEIPSIAIQKAQDYDLILAGSTWCRDKLRAKGIDRSDVLIQGVDPAFFRPLPSKTDKEHFVIFSGGMFEFRKGQDLVLAAFRILQHKYADLRLVHCWYNPWPETVALFQVSKHIRLGTGQDWEGFMRDIYWKNGLDASRITTVGFSSNDSFRELFATTDLGLFPNRCEGGTNLVLMEYMACGKPVIASLTSGHRDILTQDNAILLDRLRPLHIQDSAGKPWADWQEPSLDQVIEKIEYAYHHRDALQRLGAQAGKDLLRFTWTDTAKTLLQHLRRVGAVDDEDCPEIAGEQHEVGIAQGLRWEQAGDFAHAEQAYRQCLSASAESGEGWFRLGFVCLQQKKPQEAIQYLSRARQHRHKIADTWNLQGIALAWLQQHEEAVTAFRRALQLAPAFVDAHLNLGNALREANRFDEAQGCFHRALQLNPRSIQALEQLAIMARVQAEANEAIDAYRRILQIAPRHGPAHLELGVLLAGQRRLDEARLLLETACHLDPKSTAAFCNLGNCLMELGDMDAALAALNRALELDPADGTTHHNLGTLWGKKGDRVRASEHYRASLAARPNHAESLVGLGALHFHHGEFDQAAKSYEQALRCDPNSAQAHFNLAQLQLLRGDLLNGFRHYEWRWKTPHFTPPSFSQPPWQGARHPDRSLLLYCEQGLGDTLHFCRYAALARSRVGQVILEAPKALLPLLAGCPGVDVLVAAGDPLPPFDCHAPLMSLPRLLGTTQDSIPNSIPYLVAQPERVKRWSQRLGERRSMRVGIAWRGNPQHQANQQRSLPLRELLPLAGLPGIEWISLQKGEGTEELALLRHLFPIVDFGGELDGDGGAFLDTAALMMNLDLVICIDSAPAHLAGALGMPVWLILHDVPDWRWFLVRGDSPWYPSMQLFRQTHPGDWSGVVGRIATHLGRLQSTG